MSVKRLLLWLTIFSVSMAFLESSVVIYIRELLYPEGFAFPLAVMEPSLATTEIIREAATIIMLIGAGIIAGKNSIERFAWFIFCFAVWDIFYYLFLKLLIGWPDSVFTWDILFLIPVTWTGPVLSPLIVCIYMLIFSGMIIYFSGMDMDVRISPVECSMLIAGSLVLIFAFTSDYTNFILENYSIGELLNLPSATALFDLATRYMPEHFRWWLFMTGSLPILIAEGMIFNRLRNNQ